MKRNKPLMNLLVTGGRRQPEISRCVRGLFRAFIKHRSVKVVTFWGANDANSWRRRGHPLLFDEDNQRKPAFDAVMRVAMGEPSKSK